MTDKQIEYRAGYKYQLAKDYPISTEIVPDEAITTQFIELDTQGRLLVKSGYAWDGTSGPVKDSGRNLRASLVHDALYQLLRQERLNMHPHKDQADRLFEKMCVEDGTDPKVAKGFYEVLSFVGHLAASPDARKKTFFAPRQESESAFDPLARFGD
ncbi:MAG: DUF1353 domain-containing protein [Gammaproteobacteria bacterium]